MSNYNVYPYYDTTEEEFEKNYKRVLAVPGRNPQARELTVIQGLTLKHLENLAKTLYVDGQIIEGCELIIDGTTVTITEGKIYAGGVINSIPQQTLTITGSGTEIIGMKIEEEIITEGTDPELRDPAQGYVNYSHAGMHRIKMNINFVVNDDTAIPIWTIEDGELQTSNMQSNSALMQLLAERTFDESGNYRVYGLNVSYAREIDSNNLEIKVTPGRAYVKGWQITKPGNTFVTLPKAKDTETTLNEPHTYHAGTNKYKLIHQPVAEINTVTATVQVGSGGNGGMEMTKGIPDGQDSLGYDSVIEIVDVWDATHGSYAQGTDYILTDNSVDWSPSGAEPTQGSTYYVTFRYIKNMEEGTDYQLTFIDNEGYLDFSPAGDDPVDNTVVLVDYKWYLARADLLYMDEDGNIELIQGKSDVTEKVKPPEGNVNTLTLATIFLEPNSTEITIYEENNYRLTMDDLHEMLQRIIDNEYNIAVLDLTKSAQARESSISLRGILTDSFLNLDVCDIGNANFSAALNTTWNWLELASTSQETDLTLDTTHTTASHANDFVFLPYTHSLAINQPYATEAYPVNPYATFTRLALVTINPKKYKRYHREVRDKFTGNIYHKKRLVVGRFHRTEYTYKSYERSFRRLYERLIQKYQKRGIIPSAIDSSTYSMTATRYGWHNHLISSAAFTSTQKVGINEYVKRNATIWQKSLMRILPYAPQITVNITGENFYPNSDNLTLYVNNIRTAMTPTGSTVVGTNPGTVKSDENGNFTAQFTIPPNVPAGTVEIKVTNPTNSAITTFYSRNVIQTTIHYKANIHYITEKFYEINVRIVHRNRNVDPIAQTFEFDTNTFISKIDLYFKSKSSTEPIIFQIRGTENGYPNSTVLYEKVLQPADINVSDDGTAATTITFEYPIFIPAGREYAIGLITESNEYEVWVARGGSSDVKTGAAVTTQPYTAGVFFASSNNSAWTALQDIDLKFKMYRAVFPTSTTYYMYYNQVTGLSTFSRFEMETEEFPNDYSTITWQYSTDGGSTWTKFYPDDPDEIELGTAATQIWIRAALSTNNSRYTPMLRVDGDILETKLYDTGGIYLTKTIDTSKSPYSQVKLEYETWLPSGTAVTPYISDDEGTTWKSLTLDSTEQVDGLFYKQRYSTTLTASVPIVSATNATVDSTSGSLADGTTYYYIFTGTNAEGETTGCTEFSVPINTGSATNSIVFDLTNAFDSHTTGFKVYRSTASGSETLKYIVNNTPTTWTDDGSDTDASSNVPPTNNTAYYTADSFKAKLELTTSDQRYSPRVRNLLMIFKETI